MWFRRNKTERRYLKLAEVLIPMLGLQRTLTPDFALEADGAVNKAALGYAYGFIWVAVLAYVVYVARGLGQVNKEVDDLRRKLDGAGRR